MNEALFKVPEPKNEPIFGYLPGSSEKKKLKSALRELSSKQVEIPLYIGGREVTTGNLGKCVMPHNHRHQLGVYHKAGAEQVNMAAEAAMRVAKEWAAMPWHHRASIFLKAGELLATKYRFVANAACMLGQSKTVHQAEIDSACELIDFLRFNPYYMGQIYSEQPPISVTGTWNYLEHRPLEGFIFAVTPFNFASIAGNLPTSPAMMGNVVIWKPASSAVYFAYYFMQILREAGLPDGVINMVPGSGGQVGDPAISHPDFAGCHFTGSTEVFQGMWRKIGENIDRYKCYPRIVGETGGKDFIFAHASADLEALVANTIRGAYEYQGQKCSAASRLFLPKSLWGKFKERLLDELKTVKMGDITDFTIFMGAVIDRNAFDSIKEYIDYAKASSDGEVIFGGGCDDSVGYFIEPTVVITEDPQFRLLKEEIFGPVLTIYLYDESKLDETLEICDKGSPYGLTGAVFAQDRKAIVKITEHLVNTAGNFYINDKPTGAVVGQQPFGGSRASGTNDKAGSYLNLLRWVTPRAIKENFNPPRDYRYPFMEEE